MSMLPMLLQVLQSRMAPISSPVAPPAQQQTRSIPGGMTAAPPQAAPQTTALPYMQQTPQQTPPQTTALPMPQLPQQAMQNAAPQAQQQAPPFGGTAGGNPMQNPIVQMLLQNLGANSNFYAPGNNMPATPSPSGIGGLLPLLFQAIMGQRMPAPFNPYRTSSPAPAPTAGSGGGIRAPLPIRNTEPGSGFPSFGPILGGIGNFGPSRL